MATGDDLFFYVLLASLLSGPFPISTAEEEKEERAFKSESSKREQRKTFSSSFPFSSSLVQLSPTLLSPESLFPTVAVALLKRPDYHMKCNRRNALPLLLLAAQSLSTNLSPSI